MPGITRDMTLPVIFVLILLVLGPCREAHELMPNLIPEAKQLLLQAGDPIYFLCEGTSKIYFFYPNHPESQNDKVISSPLEIKESQTNGLYTYNFTRANSLPGDTGWYGCAYHNVTITPETKYDDPDVNWSYVYVSSPDSLFVEEGVIKIVNAIVRGKAVLPCRPTDPTVNVTLMNLESDKEVVLGKNVTFDPRFGFELSYLTLDDNSVFECSAWRNDVKHMVDYHLRVFRNISLDNPIINKETLKHVIRGQTLRVNCTITSVPKAFVLNWTTPHQSSRISTNFDLYNSGTHSTGAFSELTIENVTDEDQGEYECFVRDSMQMKSAKMYLKLHDPKITYINLTSQDPNMHHVQRFGGKIKWVVYVNAYPEPDLRWLDPNDKEIISGWPDPTRPKYIINTTSSYITLTIFRLDISDMGIYTLQAANADKLQTLNFTLDVLTKPVPILKNIESYYAPNQTAIFQCDVTAFPPPIITWSFLRCPNYPSLENSTSVELTDIHEEAIMNSFLSKARMTIDVSGNINCRACNSEGCDYVVENILVSDGNGGFGIMELEEPVAEGDNISIVCAASVYNYTEQLVWGKSRMNEKENDVVITENERIKIVKEKTPFTYRAILNIDNVRKEDSNYYICSALTTDKNNETMEYELKVYDAEPPTFRDTNMNGTTLNIDLGTEGHKTIILKCFVTGMPIPNVTWYKDGVMLQRNEQYMFLHNNNELRIMYLLERDNGKYTCSATNRLKTIEAFVNIIIKGKELSKGLIAMIAFLAITVVILVIYFTIKVRREKIMRKELLQTGLMHFEEGALECLNPDLTVDDQAELLPYDKKWEFPRERLKLGRQLGSGAFGVVMKAEAQGICDDEAVTTVAVKMVRRTTEPTYVRALASELKIMVHLGKHLNVVNLLGACTKNIAKRELLVIVEYCRFGNLHNYLLRHRSDFINQIDPATGKFDPMIGIDLLSRATSVSSQNRIKYAALSFSRSISANSETETMHYSPTDVTDSQCIPMSSDGCVLSNNSSQPGWRSNYRGDYKDHNLKPICTQDLLSWAFQVARGMEYLSQRKVLHGDLAARNILLAEDNVVKICDFGLAKTMYKDDNYKKKGDGPLPIKWMAIESIRDRIFSTQSDIWSFGIVLWEFFTLAETPYPGMEAEKQYQKLIEGYRMEQPAYATAEVYNIMSQCWKAKPTLRPSFTELVNSIGDLLEENVKAHYISLNAPYIDMNTSILDEKNDYLTMMSAPDHAALSSPTHNYMNSPTSENASEPAYLCMSPTNPRDESGIFSPRPNPEKSRFEFPSVTSDSEDAVEVSPMLQSTDNHYLKPINVQERRAEFARQRQAAKNQAIDRANDTDSGYCNAPRNLPLIDLHDRQGDEETAPKQKEYGGVIDISQDNYMNIPKRRNDLKRDVPDGFSNPSYIIMGNNDVNQTKV